MPGVLKEFNYVMNAANSMICPKGDFTADQIPDLSGRIAIVTGGNTGIGKETIKVLLQRNVKVYLGARSKLKAELAIQELKEQTGREAIFLELDLGNLASVRKTAEEYMSKESELHILFNNAGVMTPPKEMLTDDSYDLQFGTNVIGPFLFTQLLMPALLAGKASSPDEHARIVMTSSSAALVYTLNFDSFKDGPARRKMSTEQLYQQSKFADAVLGRQFANKYKDQGIISYSADPGLIQTDLQRHMPSMQRRIIGTMLRPAPMGALTQLWAGTMPEALEHNGEYLIPWARIGRCREEAYDDELGNRLWNWLVEETKER